MKRQNRFPFRVNVNLPSEVQENVRLLKSNEVDVAEIYRRAVIEAIEKAAKHFKKSAS